MCDKVVSSEIIYINNKYFLNKYDFFLYNVYMYVHDFRFVYLVLDNQIAGYFLGKIIIVSLDLSILN